MRRGASLNQPLHIRIVASAVLSVVAAALILIVGLALARPLIRDAAVLQTIGNPDMSECNANPEGWGSALGAFEYYAYDRTGRSLNPDAPPIEPDLLSEALASEWIARDERAERAVAVMPVGPDGPCAVVRLSTARPDLLILWRFLWMLALSTLTGMVVAGGATFWFVVNPLRVRIRDLSLAAGGVGTETFSPSEQPPDALGRIATVLAESHERIVETREALESQNRALQDHLAGIAHDLRTPLASMQLALEALASEAEGPLRDEARRGLADVVYLSSLVDNLHQGARLRHEVDVTEGSADLSAVVQRLERRFAIVGRHVDVEVASSVPDTEVRVACAPALAERAIANLVHNAVEHHEGGGHVALLLSVEGDRFELVVMDDGPGLPEPFLATLEAESFLVDPARPRGPGLGMLITAEIARRAGWTLTYEAREPGLRVLITGSTIPPS